MSARPRFAERGDDEKEAIKNDVGWLLSLLKECSVIQLGDTYRANCPIHGGERRSLLVSRNRTGRWGWFCFVCNEGGDVFKLMMKADGCTFPQALARCREGGLKPATYKWSPGKSRRRRTRVEVFAPCSYENCEEVLRCQLDEIPVLDVSHPAWDIEHRDSWFQIWVWCPKHHRSRESA